MTGQIIFDPLIPWQLLAFVAVLAVGGVLLAAVRGLSGWALRGLAALIVLAALSGLPQGTFASEVVIDNDKAQVTREVDGGLQTVELSLPAIVTTDLRLNEPRYAKLPDIMKAKKKPMDVKSPAELGVEVASKVKLLKVEPPAERQGGVKVGSVDELVDKLKNEAKVIS